MSLLPPTELNRFRVRLLSQVLIEATADYWEHRATTFERARPRPGDFTGRATAESLEASDERCRLAAEACRRHASLIRSEGMPGAAREVLEALSEFETARATS